MREPVPGYWQPDGYGLKDEFITTGPSPNPIGYWVVPLSTNRDRTLGEFLRLYDNGKIERITLRADDDDTVVVIKPEDGKGQT